MSIVLFEDDAFGEKLKRLLESSFGAGSVWWAQTPEDAEQILEEQRDEIQVLVADVMKDGKPVGLELVEKYSGRLPTIVISAHQESEFTEYANRLGPITFLSKGPDLFDRLSLAIKNAIVMAEDERKVDLVGEDRESLCISRKPGAILHVNIHLSTTSNAEFPQEHFTYWDFATIQVLVKEFHRQVLLQRGQVFALHDQTLAAVFPSEVDATSSTFARALACVRGVKHALGDDRRSVLLSHPFGAAIVEGVIVSGMFGVRPPGIPAVIGRLGEIASQVALAAWGGEVGVIDNRLHADSLSLFKSSRGERISRQVTVRGLSQPAECTFLSII
jgi:hypothetical protein